MLHLNKSVNPQEEILNCKYKCENGGKCIANTEKETFCECPDGFLGVNCNIKDPCQE